MIERTSRATTLAAVRTVLAADCACPESAFVDDGLLVTRAEERTGRRRFPFPSRPLLVVTMGRGVVVAAHPARLAWLQATLGDRARDTIFSAQTIAELTQYVANDGQDLHGPTIKYLCVRESFRPAANPTGIAISAVEGEAVAGLYRYAGYENALSYRLDHPRPDVAAAVARHGADIIGMAGASADCDALWQIGVDVVSAARGSGVGRALVSRVTELAFGRDRIPYYSTATSNVRSSALATSLGYWPAWTELYAKDHVAHR